MPGARQHDREILRLAIPALGALAAEPLYVLADTAIVGHLGTRQLAALALAATVLSAVVSLCNFLAYGTTAQVARLHGAQQQDRAAAIAAQALWLALAIGALIAVLLVTAAGPITHVVGGDSDAAQAAERYMRLSAAGIPCALVALAGQGYLRGVDRLVTPLKILVVANLVNVALELGLVYGFDLGLDGSALGTVIAQLGMAAAFARYLLVPGAPRKPDLERIRSLLQVGGHLLLRTGALLGSFTLASAVLARDSESALAAHQIAFQLFIFIALVLDAIAIAGQVIVGRMLGAGDADGAQAAATRMNIWSLAVGVLFALLLLAGHDLIPRAFSSDEDVLHQAHLLWPLFALMMPAGALVFALDGILIGAGDSKFIAYAMLAAFICFAPVALLTAHEHWGVVGMWIALNVLMLVRLTTMGARFASRRWAVTGAASAG